MGKVNIRQEATADYDAIAQVHRLAFGRDHEAQLVARLRAAAVDVPQLARVAETAGAIVGHIFFSYVDLAGTSRQLLSLAPLAVHPDWQNQGIGSDLVRSSLAAADGLGAAAIVVLGHEWFYPKFGFEPASRYGIRCPFSVPDDLFMVKRLRAYQPADRGQVIYAAPFSEV